MDFGVLLPNKPKNNEETHFLVMLFCFSINSVTLFKPFVSEEAQKHSKDVFLIKSVFNVFIAFFVANMLKKHRNDTSLGMPFRYLK